MIVIAFYSRGQVSTNVHLAGGFAYNSNLLINQEKVLKSRALVFQGGGNVIIPVKDKFYLSTGLTSRIIMASGQIGVSGYHSQSFKLAMPFLAGIKVDDKFQLYSGIEIQNNRDFSMININKKNNFRYNYTIRGDYRYNEVWGLLLNINAGFRTPKVYLVYDPKYSATLGIVYNLGILANK